MLKSISIIMTLLISVNVWSQDLSVINQYLDVLAEHNKFAGTLTIANNGQPIFNKVTGYAVVEDKVENTIDTKFRIGSITKAFTAVMVFQLIDEGKLKLETPLSTYFPKISGASKITVAHLLNHSSGLFNITNAPDFMEWMLEPSTRDNMLSRIVPYPLDFSPGTKTAYSNTNYLLLGYIIELEDKLKYGQSLQKRITEKIGLEHTFFGDKINVKNNESLSYTVSNDSYIPAPETDMSNPGGAGAIVSTSGDLTHFMSALFNGELMSTESFELMKKTNDGETCHGIFYHNLNGMDIYASEGGIDGFQSFLVHVPSVKATIALLANALNYRKIDIMMNVFGALNGQPIAMPTFSEITLTEEQVKLYEGNYACEAVPFNLIFKVQGNVLLGGTSENELNELTPTKAHQFKLDAMGVVLDFNPEMGTLKFTQGNESLVFTKM